MTVILSNCTKLLQLFSLSYSPEGVRWLNGMFGAFCLKGRSLNPTQAATYGPWASPSLAVASSASVW